MMWRSMLSLIQLIIDARLVVLPEPVGPVTRISPRGRVISSSMTAGSPSCSKVRNSFGIRRSTSPMLPRCLKIGHAEPGHLAEGEPEVGPADLLQLLLAALRRDALHQGRGVRRLQDLRRQRSHVAVQPEHRLAADGQVQVAGLLGDRRLQQLVDQQRAHDATGPPARSFAGAVTPAGAGPGGLDFVRSTRCPAKQRAADVELRRRDRAPSAALIIRVDTTEFKRRRVEFGRGRPARTCVDPSPVSDRALATCSGPGGRSRPGRSTPDRRTPRAGPRSVRGACSTLVIRRTSSMVVRPFSALIIPSSKSVRIPCLRATLRIFWVGSPLNVISRIWLVMVISS